jgi:hypothetical protein
MHAMTDASAAGRKTEPSNERGERLAASLEEQFHICRRETNLWLKAHRADDGYLYHNRLDGLLKLIRTNAQLAQVITQIDRTKNRKTNTQ